MKAVKDMALDDVIVEAKEITPVLKKAFEEAGSNLDMSKVTVLGASLASVLFAVALLCSGQNSTLTGTLAGRSLWKVS